MDPDNINKGKVKTISQLIRFFPNIITSDNAPKTDDEWRELCHFNFKEHFLTEEKKH